MRLSIIIPAHNEGRRIKETLLKYLKYKWKYKVDILVILNGCTDDTLGIVKSIKDKRLKHIVLKEANKGGAIIKGFRIAEGDLISYVDADGATEPKELERLVGKINAYDGVIGSRWINGAIINTKQPLLRRIASRGFNLLVRIILGLRFKDTQAGVKIFKKKAIKSIVNKLMKTNWAIDVSILYPLVKNGYKIKEEATIWEDKKGSRLKLYKAVPNMFSALIKLKLKY
ncbi:MAG: glycosyltransferase [Nanoarchaeota archaeon]